MRPVLATLAIIVAALGVAAAALAGGDRQTLVPPPDATAESFMRQVAQRRYELAPRYLSTQARKAAGPEQLRAWFDPIRQQLGPANRIDATIEWIAGNRASARASVDAEKGSAMLLFPMIQEHGLWVIAAFPADIPIRLTSRGR